MATYMEGGKHNSDETEAKFPIRVNFLDYEIVNSGNMDGYILLKHKPYNHLGGYSTMEWAKKAATLHFMIDRPHIFAHSIWQRCVGRGGCMGEYYLLKDEISKLGLDMPPEITCSRDMNGLVYFMDEKITMSPPVHHLKTTASELMRSITAADPNVVDDYENSDHVIRSLYNKCNRLLQEIDRTLNT